jgi:pimeloyl-ACP methyl ester carboxylesterase
MPRLLTLALIGLLLGSIEEVQQTSAFFQSGNVKLHYVDWGGQDDAIIFLTGLGDTLERFDSFAPSFVDRFHVLGLTRRGQGDSDKPASGYDTSTLANDIEAFLDAKSIARVSLIGHSIAGLEMTRFAELHPERLSKMVYLDAVLDGARDHERAVKAKLPSHKSATEALAAIGKAASEYRPDFRKVKVPVLAYFVVYDRLPEFPPQMNAETRKRNEALFRVYAGQYQREQIERFRKSVKKVRVVEFHDTNHFFFNDPKHTGPRRRSRRSRDAKRRARRAEGAAYRRPAVNIDP